MKVEEKRRRASDERKEEGNKMKVDKVKKKMEWNNDKEKRRKRWKRGKAD
jgi:hypothetical protein